MLWASMAMRKDRIISIGTKNSKAASSQLRAIVLFLLAKKLRKLLLPRTDQSSPSLSPYRIENERGNGQIHAQHMHNVQLRHAQDSSQLAGHVQDV